MSAELRWAKGGEGDITVLDGDRITVRSTTASAPGSRPDGALPSGGALRVKVARCRKDGDRFVIEGRLIDTTRNVRLELQTLLGEGTPS